MEKYVLTRSRAQPIHRYVNREPYRLAMGRACQRPPVEDRLSTALAMVDLDGSQPPAARFCQLLKRELKIRGYSRQTIGSYISTTCALLRWLGKPPHLLTREHVKDYLEFLVDAGRCPSDLAVRLSAIRTSFDKFCFRDVTLGLVTPRRPRKKLSILSRQEVIRLLEAAPSLRDKLLIGLMYGTGMRVSEVASLRWRDIQWDRQQIKVKQGKGNADRHVQLPEQYRAVLKQISTGQTGEEFVFPSESAKPPRGMRHLTSRTVQRAVQRAAYVARINRKVTPHSLRHAYATHSFENGCDIRRIQKLLGHVRLETTTIYVNVAKNQTNLPSPLDRLPSGEHAQTGPEPLNSEPKHVSALSQLQATTSPRISHQKAFSPPLGELKLHSRLAPQDENVDNNDGLTQFTLEINFGRRREFLIGTTAKLPRDGFVAIQLPPAEHWTPTLQAIPGKLKSWLETSEFYIQFQEAITQTMLKPPT